MVERLVIGDVFRPDIGYVRRSDIRLSQGQLRFSPRPQSSRIVRKYSWTAHMAYTENGAGRVETRDMRGEFGIEFQNSDTLRRQLRRFLRVPACPRAHRRHHDSRWWLRLCDDARWLQLRPAATHVRQRVR